jgi:NTE family protein
MNPQRRLLLSALSLSALSACTILGGGKADEVLPAPPVPAPPPLKVALVLGGGAARGFAHIGVIKALEAQGIVPDLVVGTSAGAVVGSLYAAGLNGFELQKLALEIEENQFSDWSLPDRGVLKGEALQNFINKAVGNRPLEKLPRSLAVVATDLASGEPVAFRTGNTGMAVRASAAVPGVFQPTHINGRDYVDGGLVSPVPVRTARELGAGFVIAVDISARPRDGRTRSSFEVLLQTFAIMGQALGRHETATADVVIRPHTSELAAADFNSRHKAVLEGEKAAAAVMSELKAKLEQRRTAPR